MNNNLGHYGFTTGNDRRQTNTVLQGILHSQTGQQRLSRSSSQSYKKHSDTSSLRSQGSFSSTVSLLKESLRRSNK